MRTSARSSTARSRAARRESARWALKGSAIWFPMVRTGLRAAPDAWKTRAICFPLTRRICSFDIARRSRPFQRIAPRSMRPAGGRRRMRENASIDFPEPDSPTTARVSPAWMRSETSFTGRIVPVSVPRRVVKPRVSSKSSLVSDMGRSARSMLSEYASQAIRNLAERGLCLDRGQDRGHQVRIALGDARHVIERLHRFGRIAPRAKRTKSFHLVVLDRGIHRKDIDRDRLAPLQCVYFPHPPLPPPPLPFLTKHS